MTTPIQFIYLCGIDGSGKTTAVNYLVEHLQKRNRRVESVWLRFNHFYSRPLLILARLLGYTRYETVDGLRVGYHNFYRSKWLSRLYVALQYRDARRAIQKIVRQARQAGLDTVVLDRFVYDILIDLEIATREPMLRNAQHRKRFAELIPPSCRVVCITRDRTKIYAARPESRADRNFEARWLLYAELSQQADVHQLENESGLNELHSNLDQLIGSVCGKA